MKTVIVTGAAGFIGSNLASALLQQDYRVVGVDNFDDAYRPVFKEENIAPFLANKNFVLSRTDICDTKKLREIFVRERPHYVAHLAAKTDTRDAVNVPEIYTKINIGGTLNILKLAQEFAVANLVIASSSSVYGNTPAVPWREDEVADRPLSPYGATKRAAEILAYTYHHNFHLNITCLRYFNVYGKNNRPNMVPYLWTEKMLKEEEIELSGDGSRRRDYTYITDVTRGTIFALEKPLGFEILNIGNSQPLSLKELLAVFETVIGRPARVRTRPSHQASVENTYADISRAGKLLGWKPEVPIAEGIENLVKWFRQHRLKNPV